MSYQPTKYETALWRWIDKCVGALVSEIRFANQAQPIAGDTSVVIRVLQTQQLMTPKIDIKLSDSGLPVYVVSEHRTGTVSINAFGPNHREVMALINSSLWYPPAVDNNTANGVEIQNAITAANDLTALVSTDYIGRTQQDFRFAYNTTWKGTDKASAIIAVQSAGDVSGLVVDSYNERPRNIVAIESGHAVTVSAMTVAGSSVNVVANHLADVSAGIVSSIGASVS